MDKRVESVVSRAALALDYGKVELDELIVLIGQIARSPERRSLIEDLITALQKKVGAGSNADPTGLERFALLLTEEIERLEGEMEDWEENKNGTWNYVIFASGGGCAVGLAGWITGTAGAISPIGSGLLGCLVLTGFLMRKRAHLKRREARETSTGLKMMLESIRRRLA